MIKIGELKQGDIVRVNDDGVERDGVVIKVNHVDHLALVDNSVQEFWYGPEDIKAVPLDESQLLKLGFEKQEYNGSAKYLKGAFRLVTPRQGDFSNIEMWYREDRRHFSVPLGVHQLQNLHLDMTKVHLELP